MRGVKRVASGPKPRRSEAARRAMRAALCGASGESRVVRSSTHPYLMCGVKRVACQPKPRRSEAARRAMRAALCGASGESRVVRSSTHPYLMCGVKRVACQPNPRRLEVSGRAMRAAPSSDELTLREALHQSVTCSPTSEPFWLDAARTGCASSARAMTSRISAISLARISSVADSRRTASLCWSFIRVAS